MMSLDDMNVSKTMAKQYAKKGYVVGKFAMTMVVAAMAVVVFTIVLGVVGFFKESYTYLTEQCPEAISECYEDYRKELSELDDQT